jgi:hypothetical protein
MTITDAVCQHLVGAPAVAAFVGPRVYQLKLPQQPTLPAVRVQLIAEPARYHLRGVLNAWEALVQVDAYATEFDRTFPDPYAQVQQLATAIDDALSGRLATIGTIAIVGCFRLSRGPLYEPGELRLARILQEYRCIYHDRARLTRTIRRPEDVKELTHHG